MKKSVTYLTLLLVCLMMLGLSACTDPASNATSAPTAAATAKATQAPAATATPAANTEPVVITAIIDGNGNVPTEENTILTAIAERTGYIYDPLYVPSSDTASKLSAMIASDTLPDILNLGSGDALEFKQNGLIIELSELLNSYGPEVLADKEGLLDFGINTEGEIWGIPNGWLDYYMMAVRADWLETLNLEMPTDLDSLYEVQKAFTFDDPDQNGQDDTLGCNAFMGTNATFATVFGAYGIPMNRNIQLEDGTVTSWLLHPDFLEPIGYYRTLFEEGIMDSEFATIPTSTFHENVFNCVYGTICYSPVGTTNNWMGRYNCDPQPDWGITTIAGPDGTSGTPAPHYSAYTCIAAGSEHPEDTMKLLNFFYNREGNELIYLGVEGVHYEWSGDPTAPVTYLEPFNDKTNHRADGGYVYWDYFISKPENCAQTRSLNETTRNALSLGAGIALPDAQIYTPLQADVEYGGVLSGIINEALAQLIVTNGDLEAEYQAFVERWLNEGGSEWQEEATRVYAQENGG